MVFNPRFQEPSDSLILDNLLAIVKRDMKPALDFYFEDEDLADFQQRTIGEFITLKLPTFAISPKGNAPVESDDASFVAENLKLNLLMGVGHADAPTATRLATKYVRALKSVLRSASIADWTAGFPENCIFALNIEIAYEYGLIGKNANATPIYEKMVHVELTLKFNER